MCLPPGRESLKSLLPCTDAICRALSRSYFRTMAGVRWNGDGFILAVWSTTVIWTRPPKLFAYIIFFRLVVFDKHIRVDMNVHSSKRSRWVMFYFCFKTLQKHHPYQLNNIGLVNKWKSCMKFWCWEFSTHQYASSTLMIYVNEYKLKFQLILLHSHSPLMRQ